MVAVYEALVAPEISVNDVLFEEDCHCKLPADPLVVNVVLLILDVTVVPPLKVPAIEPTLMAPETALYADDGALLVT